MNLCKDGREHDWRDGETARWCAKCWLVNQYPAQRKKTYSPPRGRVHRRQRLGSPGRILRAQVIERDGHTCAYCGRPVIEGGALEHGVRVLTLDHIISRSKGGKNTLENLCVSCLQCNMAKADK